MEATLIYPHQLFAKSPALSLDRTVFLIEEPLLLTHNPTHTQKVILHKLSLDAYEAELKTAGYITERISIHDHKTTKSVFNALQEKGVTTIHVVDTTDNFLERAIAHSDLERIWYDSPLFILPKKEACERFTKSRKFMSSFYKQLRKDKQILVNEAQEPFGEKWSFDEDNRKKIPKGAELPEEITLTVTSPEITAAITWAESVPGEQYGEAGCWLPYTRDAAEEYLYSFFQSRFHLFGTYEDAMHTDGVRLWHSTISPLLNIGLLSPHTVLDTAITYAEKHDVPLNSLEGFIRQILGWREFIRASYEVDGSAMRTSNFFNHSRSLPDSYWTGDTGLMPVDHSIATALRYGYTHHIERLMVTGNALLLSQIHPDEVYRWFMGMYIDAYDWVMVPNVYGMSQFADGGSFATKPYIAGANYLKKMSNYPSDTDGWEKTLTALYWNFINTHYDAFKQNHRMSMMPNLLDRMKRETRAEHLRVAEEYLTQI